MSTINIEVQDQVASLASTPLISAGDTLVDKIHVSFDSTWNPYSIYVVFTNRNNVKHKSSITNPGECYIPPEIMKGETWIKIGFYGINGNKKLTSTLLKYRIVAGPITEEVKV